jgi:hypothetical protein
MRRIADAVGNTRRSTVPPGQKTCFELHRAGFDRLRAAMRTPTPSSRCRQRLMPRRGSRFAIENPHYYELMFILATCAHEQER